MDNSQQNLSDEELVGQILVDQDFFSILVKRYQQKLFRYIRRITNIRDENIEDLLQDIFIKVYLNLNDFNPELKFSSWIYRIAHNEVISQHRKHTARIESRIYDMDDTVLESIAADFKNHEQVDYKFTKEAISKVFDKMDIKYKEVLILKYLEEKNYEEMSDILKKPMGTIATLLNRAKKQFKKIVEDGEVKF